MKDFKIGDLIIDKNYTMWIIFEFDENKDHVYVTHFQSQSFHNYLNLKDDILYHESKPDNVEHLFIKRRERNLKGLEGFFK